MANRKVCVFGCPSLGAYVHRFPHPTKHTKLFSTWLSIVGQHVPDLLDLNPMKIYASKRICDFHFRREDKVTGHRLIHLAVPHLHFEGITKTVLRCMEIEHNYCVPRHEPVTLSQSVEDHLNKPSTSQAMSSEISGSQLCNKTSIVMDIEPKEWVTPRQSILKEELFNQPSTSKAVSSEGIQLSNKAPLVMGVEHYKRGMSRDSVWNNNNKIQIRRLQKEVVRLQKRTKTFKARLRSAEKLSMDVAFQKISKNMSISAKIFTGMQYRETKKSPKGRRFTMNEKILSLSLFKRSPKAYKLMSKLFTLPSTKSLRNILAKIRIIPGINIQLFEKIKDTVKDLVTEERLCTLIFDEMSISPQLHYNSASDELKGFSSCGDTEKIADHALVFMVKGIVKNFKQPVAYYFTNNLKSTELKEIIIEVVTNVHRTGLKILSTVCDQSAVNVSAINSLVNKTKENHIKQNKEWRREVLQIGNATIIPLFDVPHLLKGLRNNLLSKDLKYIDLDDGKSEKFIKWEYFKMVYEADKSYGELKLLPKLTDEHIYLEKIKKMRVKTAAQIFSRSVAVAAEHITARGDIPIECRQIVPFVQLIDELFDSLNVGTFHIPNAKVYKGGVRKNTPHHKLWQKAILFLKNVKYFTIKGDKVIETSVPSIKNLIKTIEGVQHLWCILHNKYSVDTLLTRNLNQDPVENFFGSIRSLGIRNISPNSVGFEGAYKALLLNNFATRHSIGSNCEEDCSKYIQTLDFFLKQSTNKVVAKIVVDQEIILSNDLTNVLMGSNVTEPTGSDQSKYVCGWVLYKCRKNIIKKCRICAEKLFSDDPSGNEYITAKEYTKNKKWLNYPSKCFFDYFSEMQNVITTFLKTSNMRLDLKKTLKSFITMFIPSPFECEKHNMLLEEYVKNTCINIILYSWCRAVNRILSGKITYVGDDRIKNAAQNYYNKHKKK